jgi:hypothetical protein
MTTAAAAPPALWFKAALFAALAWNTAAYVHSGTPSEALDSAAWLALLVLFELETDFGNRFRGNATATAIRAARLAAAAAVCAAAAGYVLDEEWPDAVNTALWIGVVALLEIQVRARGAAVARRAWFAAATATLYAGLGALVMMWAWRGEWFDAYDALLWLVALVVIELNVLRGLRPAHAVRRRRRAGTRRGSASAPPPAGS